VASELPTRLTERTPRSARVPVAGDVVARVTGLYEAGLYVDAYEASKVAGPLGAWSGAEALVIASRLASNLGSVRLGSLLITRAHREHPRSGTVRSFWCHHLLGRHGPIVAEREARAAEAQVDDTWSSESRSDLLALRARVAATSRDGDASAALIARARATSPNDPWPVTTASIAADLEDRPEQALALAREALAMRPGFAPRSSTCAAAPRRAPRRRRRAPREAMRSTVPPSHEVRALPRIRDPARRSLLDRVGPLALRGRHRRSPPMPLPRPRAAGRSRRSRAQARRIGTGHHRALAERLSHQPGWRRVHSRPFVVQAHRTCSPTLAALSAFAGTRRSSKNHRYGGMAATANARVATARFVAQEFRSPEAAVRLIDARRSSRRDALRGLGAPPAVVGYDSARRTLLLQGGRSDPGPTRKLTNTPRARGLVFEGDQEQQPPGAPRSATSATRRRRHSRFDRAAGGHAPRARRRRTGPRSAVTASRWRADDTVEIRRVLEGALARFPDTQHLVSQSCAPSAVGTRAGRL
jgi:hypothetical protein